MILKLITEIYRPERAAQTMFSYAEAQGVRVKLESQQPISRRVVACKRNVMARVSRSSSCSRARSNLIERNNVKRGLKTANGTVAGKSGVYTPVERLPRTNKKYFLAPTHTYTHVHRAPKINFPNAFTCSHTTNEPIRYHLLRVT